MAKVGDRNANVLDALRPNESRVSLVTQSRALTMIARLYTSALENALYILFNREEGEEIEVLIVMTIL